MEKFRKVDSVFEKHGKSLFIAINVIFTVVGVIGFIAGIGCLFVLPSKLFGALLMVGGILTAAIHFVGFWGARKENTTVLKVYAWILIIFIVLAIIGAITDAEESTSELDPQIAKLMDSSNAMTYVNMAIEILCVILAFGIASAISRRKDSAPPLYSDI